MPLQIGKDPREGAIICKVCDIGYLHLHRNVYRLSFGVGVFGGIVFWVAILALVVLGWAGWHWTIEARSGWQQDAPREVQATSTIGYLLAMREILTLVPPVIILALVGAAVASTKHILRCSHCRATIHAS